MKLARFLIILLSIIPFLSFAQPANYWSNSFSTEASLLSGAVVGGNAEITSIFYNPAGISDISQSRIDLNASLFYLEHKKYGNPLGEKTQMENWFFKVFPRFASYLYPSKKHPSFTYQFAIFNRNNTNTSIYNRVKKDNTKLIYPDLKEIYTGLFELNSNYDDYWGSLGISKKFNGNWSVGVSLNMSVQSLRYFRSATANVSPTISPINDSLTIVSSNWQASERIRAYNWRFIGKIGLRYTNENWSAGLNVTLPSMRLFGNADVNKTVSQTNIYYQNNKQPDFYRNEYPQYAYFVLKDPFSIALGLKYHAPEYKSDYFLTIEFFAPISEYKTVDPTIITGNSEVIGSEFSTYSLGNIPVLNFALGYKKMIRDGLGILAGFRTDFNPYIMGYNERYWEENSFESLNINLFHFTGGVKFDYKKSSFILGLQNTYGIKNHQKEFINFSNPVAYNPNTKLALQGNRNNNMKYSYIALGFYLGFSIAF